MTTTEALKNIKLTPNFTAYEFCNSQDGCAIILPNMELPNKLQALRQIVGPITITSGYRTPKFNAEVDGSTNSNHLKGLAADIKFSSDKYTLDGVKKVLSGVGFNNIGIYIKNGKYQWFHVDTAKRWEQGNGWVHYNGSAIKVYNL